MSETCCACLTVKHVPEKLENNLLRERWLCESCGNQFVKQVFLKKLEAENAELKKRVDDWNEVYQKKMDELEAIEKVSDARWEENQSLKKRVEELESGALETFFKAFQNAKATIRVDTGVVDLINLDEKNQQLTSLCKTMAEALDELEISISTELKDLPRRTRAREKAKLALEQYRKERGE